MYPRLLCLSFVFTPLLRADDAFDAQLAGLDADGRIDAIVERIEQPKIPDRVFSIVDFGAVEGGETDVHSALQTSIKTAAQAGGGRVVVPAGKWLCEGPVVLQSRIELHLEEGAHLLFGPDPASYLPTVLTRWEGTELYGYSPLVYAYNVTDVAITGSGIIDGNAESRFHSWFHEQSEDQLRLREMGVDGVPRAERIFGEGTYLRPSLIQIVGGERVLLEDYGTRNSPFWINHLVYVDHLTVRGLQVDSHFPNNDGVDLDSCRYALVEGNHFRTGDDSVVVKSGRDRDGREVGRRSAYIVVRHNDMGGEDGVALGSEMSGGIRHVYFTDNVLRNGISAIRFKANEDRGGTVEDILVRNLQVESFERHLIWFQLTYPGLVQGGFPSTYRNLVFENIEAQQVGTFFEAHAPAAAPLENVVLRNITVHNVENTFILDEVKGLQLENVTLGEQRIDGSLSWQSPVE